MSILLCHNSSLECLRAVPPQAEKLHPTTQALHLEEVTPARGELAKLEPQQVGIVQRPLHHLIPMGLRRSDARGVVSHRTGMKEVPQGLILEAAPDIYACGPEMTFVQMASCTSLVGAVVLGHELCGSYAHFARLVSGFYERPPLTSVERIKEAMEQLSHMGMHGMKPAREALRWVRNGSASPMETVVSCMIHLPKSMGGFGLMAPMLNYEVQLDDAAKRMTGTDTCRVDTAYIYETNGTRRKEGLEFDGRDYHRDAEADRMRREALAHMGWTIYVLNVDELKTYRKVRDKVALLDKIPRQRGLDEVEEKAGRQLLKRLLHATRCGMGLEAALFGVPLPKGKVKLHL